MNTSHFTFKLGDKVQKKMRTPTSAKWRGTVTGFYSNETTPEGYALESIYHKHTVQIYPEKALEEINITI